MRVPFAGKQWQSHMTRKLKAIAILRKGTFQLLSGLLSGAGTVVDLEAFWSRCMQL